ncbi:YraN family protein [Sinomicrobium sp.]
MATHNDFGIKGENIAADYLREQGYAIIERNYTFARAEIDIIALKGDMLAAVEVKARSSPLFALPNQTVSPKKIRLLVKAMDHYVRYRKLDTEVRFDIITIIGDEHKYELNHLKNAFFHF